jgi:hypothetical protein
MISFNSPVHCADVIFNDEQDMASVIRQYVRVQPKRIECYRSCDPWLPIYGKWPLSMSKLKWSFSFAVETYFGASVYVGLGPLNFQIPDDWRSKWTSQTNPSLLAGTDIAQMPVGQFNLYLVHVSDCQPNQRITVEIDTSRALLSVCVVYNYVCHVDPFRQWHARGFKEVVYPTQLSPKCHQLSIPLSRNVLECLDHLHPMICIGWTGQIVQINNE